MNARETQRHIINLYDKFIAKDVIPSVSKLEITNPSKKRSYSQIIDDDSNFDAHSDLDIDNVKLETNYANSYMRHNDYGSASGNQLGMFICECQLLITCNKNLIHNTFKQIMHT